MTELYAGILDFISRRTLRQDEENFLRERYEKIQKRQFSRSGLFAASNGGNMIINIGRNIFMRNSERYTAIRYAESAKKTSLWGIISGIFSRLSRSAESYHDTRAEMGARKGVIVQACSSFISSWLGGKNIDMASVLIDSATGFVGAGRIAGFIISGISGIFDYISGSNRADAELEREFRRIDSENIYDTVNFLGGLSSLCSSSYFDYQNHKAELLDGLDAKLWKLKKEDIEDCNNLQKRLLNSSWNLMRRYKLPDDFRLDQENIKHFYIAVDEPYAPRRMRMLKNIEARFRMYPPYWFYRGQTARAMNDTKETALCFGKFNEVWRPVLRQDPYRAEIAKYTVSELAELLMYGFNESASRRIINHLDILLKNSPQNDWVSYNFAGLGYYASGEKEKAERCIANNIDFNFEKEISGALLKRIKADSIDILSLSNELEDICVQGIISEAKDKDTAEILACYLKGDYAKLNEKLKNYANPEKNIIISEVIYLTTRHLTPSNEYLAVLDNIQSRIESMKSKSEEPYADILPLLKFYLERGSKNANMFAGRRFYYGLGVKRDAERAAEFFLSSEGFYAEYMLGLCYLEPGNASKAEEFFLKSALSEDFSPALFELGQIYSTGKYKAKDYETASKLFLRASMRGYKPAQSRLGDLYYEGGNNISQSYYNAYVWYQVYEFDDGEEKFFSNTFDGIASNALRLGGFIMGDETPSERIKLIEGYGWLNAEKLTERERFKARDEAQRIIRRIESRTKRR